jgi:hypothetical protein
MHNLTTQNLEEFIENTSQWANPSSRKAYKKSSNTEH